jgi:hypothetical protein
VTHIIPASSGNDPTVMGATLIVTVDEVQYIGAETLQRGGRA